MICLLKSELLCYSGQDGWSYTTIEMFTILKGKKKNAVHLSRLLFHAADECPSPRMYNSGDGGVESVLFIITYMYCPEDRPIADGGEREREGMEINRR
jgi:hypothetical protein